MNSNISEIGIIDEINNPFAVNRPSWIEQAYGLTKHRKAQLLPLFNMTKDNILHTVLKMRQNM